MRIRLRWLSGYSSATRNVPGASSRGSMTPGLGAALLGLELEVGRRPTARGGNGSTSAARPSITSVEPSSATDVAPRDRERDDERAGRVVLDLDDHDVARAADAVDPLHRVAARDPQRGLDHRRAVDRRWRTAGSRAGTRQRSSAPIHQSSVQLSPTT